MPQYQPKDELVLGKTLKVQELCVEAGDKGLFVIDTDVFVLINEPVEKVVACYVSDVGATPALTALQPAICDSSLHTAGGDKKCIQLTGKTSIAADEHVVIKYIVQE